jgi:hypothetical protein
MFGGAERGPIPQGTDRSRRELDFQVDVIGQFDRLFHVAALIGGRQRIHLRVWKRQLLRQFRGKSLTAQAMQEGERPTMFDLIREATRIVDESSRAAAPSRGLRLFRFRSSPRISAPPNLDGKAIKKNRRAAAQ